MKRLAFIDPFVVTPALNCFNDFVDLMKRPVSYHMPSKFGITTLEQVRMETDGYIVVGSASHVTEPLEWHGPLAQFLLEELNRKKPVFGCCFGHQLLCHALGSTVDYAHVNQEKYNGVREIKVTKDYLSLKAGEKIVLPVTHRQVVKTLGQDLISIGEGLANDIVGHRKLPMLTTQAHPEASRYFCQSDIQNLDAKDASLARGHGQGMIKKFFTHFGI